MTGKRSLVMACSRCGAFYDSCVHYGLNVSMSEREAERVQARYAIGKLHNPDHDTTSYRDAPTRQEYSQPVASNPNV